MRVEIYDYDKGVFDSDDPMGVVLLPISALLSGRVIDAWLPVQPCSGCSRVSGEVRARDDPSPCVCKRSFCRRPTPSELLEGEPPPSKETPPTPRLDDDCGSGRSEP